jgi:flagellar protein FlaI
MARPVPVLDFVHELRNAGVGVELWAILADAQRHWDELPRDRQLALLARAKATGLDPANVRVRAVRARGRAGTRENAYFLLERADRASGLASSLLYAPFPISSAHDESAAIASTALTNAGWAGSTATLLHELDLAWGKGAYDAPLDGPLVDGSVPLDARVVETTWLIEPFARACIHVDAHGGLVYAVEEPRLTDLEEALMATVNERLRDTLIREPGESFLAPHVAQAALRLLRMYRPDIDRRTAYRIGYYFLRNYLGAGPIEPLMRDPQIEDISCNGPDLPTFVAHARHQSIKTNVVMDELALNSFTIKLAQRGGKLLSVAQPLVDATLPDGSRLQAALGREVTSRGSAFTIRKFREDPLTAVDLIRNGTHSLDTMAFLWLAVEMRRSLIIMGATASGKTTTLNCISQFIPPPVKIVSIEDTREITLQHENWLAAVTRDGIGSTAEGIGMFDLLRAALRQRPEYLIVGEIRGQEGLTLFQAMSTGHTCFSTMHAGSVENAVYRLENAPINVPRVMLTSLDFLLLQGQVDSGKGPTRRMLSLTELSGVDPQTRNLRTNEVFRYEPNEDKPVGGGHSSVLEATRNKLGWTRARLDDEIASRRAVLERLVQENRRHYTDVARAVRGFYDARGGADALPAPTPQEVARRRDALDELLERLAKDVDDARSSAPRARVVPVTEPAPRPTVRKRRE